MKPKEAAKPLSEELESSNRACLKAAAYSHGPPKDWMVNTFMAEYDRWKYRYNEELIPRIKALEASIDSDDATDPYEERLTKADLRAMLKREVEKRRAIDSHREAVRQKVEEDIKTAQITIDELKYSSPMNHDITVFNRGRIKQAQSVLKILSSPQADGSELK